MTQRAEQVAATADQQIEHLLDQLTQETAESLQRPCPGREKLGDGTVGALISHTADNYRRIADFALGTGQPTAGHRVPAGGHGMLPRLLRGLGHRRDHSGHGTEYSGREANPDELVARLTATRASLAQIAALSDERLDAIPPDRSFRFCDGKRNVEDVLSALLRHQGRQLDALYRRTT